MDVGETEAVPSERQVLVLVTGSARSGTSALAGSLHHLGYHVPQPMVPASERNAKGHFEPWFSIQFHKKHLRRAGVRSGDAGPETQQRLAEVVADPAVRAELREWLALQPEPRLVVKDPHAVRLLDVWRDACADLGIELRHLATVRHPAEVVGSRDLVWGQDRDDRERASKEITNVAGWIQTSLVTERHTRGQPAPSSGTTTSSPTGAVPWAACPTSSASAWTPRRSRAPTSSTPGWTRACSAPR